ncbi:MAG: hypothetical protein Q4D37_10035 [Oscillospiraceae bacterium]|nr:hypothetical protein [Oscillospiraceae bacterium]
MNWIESNNGNLINLENVCHIFLDEKEVCYCFVSGTYGAEEFDTEEEAKKRMEELKKKLL